MTRRAERVARNLLRHIAQIVDEELELPAMSTVTRVTCDSGLTEANVHISVYGDEATSDEVIHALEENAWFIRKELSARVQMKRTPHLVFVPDRSLHDGQEMIDLIDRLAKAE